MWIREVAERQGLVVREVGVHPVSTGADAVRLLPTSDEVEFMGFAGPHGTVEDWLVQTKRAKLHPQDQEIVEKWRPEFEDAPAAVVPEPEPVMDVTDPRPASTSRPPRASSTPSRPNRYPTRPRRSTSSRRSCGRVA
jgi:hypothetical protein